MANKAYKYRMYPTDEQEIMFAKTFGCVRFIYNQMLADRKKYYDVTGEKLSNTPAQYKSLYPWLKEVDSLALANAQMNLNAAYNNFFRNTKTNGFPKFKSKKRSKCSYTTNNQSGTIYIDNGFIRLPKIGKVKIKEHRSIKESEKIKSATISKTPSGEYYVSVLVEIEMQIQEVQVKKVLGLDYSMKELYIDSNGLAAKYPRFYRKSEEKLSREYRKLSHMKYGSNNYEKQRIIVAKLHGKIANQRKDFLHKESRTIAEYYDAVCVETLNIKKLSQENNFGKSVSDNGWGMFLSFLEYKLAQLGKKLIKVDKFFASSQICNKCGYKNEEIKDFSIRSWYCPKCGEHHDRDKNAAINIKKEGMKLLNI